MHGALMAAFWGGVAGISLLLGAAIGLFARVPQRVIAAVMAVGAGVLISSVAFELMDDAYRSGGLAAAAGGLTFGSVLYFLADSLVNRHGGRHRKRSRGEQADGSAIGITIGALMDGIPESVAIGTSLLGGGSVGWVLVVAVFLSNIPESLCAASGMKKAGHSARFILGLWIAVVVVSALASLAGYTLLGGASAEVLAAIQAFAAGAILTMLASTMMPEAYHEGGSWVGVVTTLGFLAAFTLSKLQK